MQELKCNNCGAIIEREFAKDYVCPYCGSRFIVDTPKGSDILTNLIRYGYTLLSEFEFEKAYSVFENGLNYDFENPDVRFGLLLAKTNVSAKEKFVDMDKSLEKTNEYVNALKYSNEDTKKILSACFRNDNVKKEKHPRYCRCIDCNYYISNVQNKRCKIYDKKPIAENGFCIDFKWKK